VRRAVQSAVLLAAVASSGCLVLSLQPAYDAASVAFDEALVGQWEDPDDQTTVTIEPAQWRSYKITITDRSSTHTFQGNLTKIGSSMFMNVTEVRGNDFGPYLVPVHGIIRVKVQGDTLTASDLHYDWFMQAIPRKTLGRLAAAMDDRRNVILSSTTAELRAWLARAPADAFDAPTTFTRKHAPGAFR
jgi:hypothetical protein